MRTHLRRLMGFLRPYRAQLWGSLVFAWLAMGMTVLIPLLVGQRGQRDPGSRQARAAAPRRCDRRRRDPAAGADRVRRLIAGKVSLAVEFDLRQRFYTPPAALELGFFDSQQTGQLMSRATVDLQAIRFFLGYGLIFITQNLLTITLAAAVMFVLNPALAAAGAGAGADRRYTAARYNRLSRPALQEVQQRIAELTAEAEENVSGIRIVKAFAREEHKLHRFQRAVGRVFDQSIFSTRLRAFFSPMIGLLPQTRHRRGAAGRRAPGDQRQPRLGDLTAFYVYLVMLAGPMRMLGIALGMSQRAVASGNRLFEILDREPQIQSPPGAPALPPGGGEVQMRGVDPALRRRRSGAERASTSTCRAGRTVALVGPSGVGQDQPGGADRAPL